MPASPTARAQATARRAQVATLLLERRTQQEIAAQLKISQSMVSADVQAVRAAWAREAAADVYELIAQECRALDADERAWRARWEAALIDDVPLAIHIYGRCIAPISTRRARLRGMLPPPAPINSDVETLDTVLMRLGLGPDAGPVSHGARKRDEPSAFGDQPASVIGEEATE